MLYTAEQRMREYRPDWDNFPVEQAFTISGRAYQLGDTFVRAEAGMAEHEVARMYRLKFIGRPLVPARPTPAARPPVRPAPPLPRGR